jgi:asparagine synthase (glutamine-hydrolysing)
VPEPATIYSDVRAILPGEGLEISSSGLKPFFFRERIPTPDLPFKDDDQAIGSVRQIVSEAVRSRLLSDVPVGAFLSGGLDSSIVCTVARRELAELHTFSVGFESVADPYHGYSDESALAEAYAKELGTKHTTVRVTGDDFRALLTRFVKAAGQPYAVSSGLGILAIARAAHEKGIKVLLSGDGADEAFGGYSWYPAIPQSFTVPAVPGDTLRFLDRDGSLEQRIARVAAYPARLRAWAWHYYASEEEKAALFHEDIKVESSLRWFSQTPLQEPLDYLRHDRAFYFPYEMLSKVDRMTMAFSVEGRAPFAAPAVQKFAARLPWRQLIRDGQLKWVLRQAFAGDLPQDIVARPKHGFNVPIDHWLQGEWNDLLQDTFSETAPLRRAGLLSPQSRDQAMALLNDPRKVPGHVLFTFVMLHLWMSSIEN